MTTPPPEITEPIHDELSRHLDWSFWGTGMADTFREPLAESMLAGITPEQRQQANDLITRWRDHRDFVGRDLYEAQKAELDAARADLAAMVDLRDRAIARQDQLRAELDEMTKARDAAKRLAARHLTAARTQPAT